METAAHSQPLMGRVRYSPHHASHPHPGTGRPHGAILLALPRQLHIRRRAAAVPPMHGGQPRGARARRRDRLARVAGRPLHRAARRAEEQAVVVAHHDVEHEAPQGQPQEVAAGEQDAEGAHKGGQLLRPFRQVAQGEAALAPRPLRIDAHQGAHPHLMLPAARPVRRALRHTVPAVLYAATELDPLPGVRHIAGRSALSPTLPLTRVRARMPDPADTNTLGSVSRNLDILTLPTFFPNIECMFTSMDYRHRLVSTTVMPMACIAILVAISRLGTRIGTSLRISSRPLDAQRGLLLCSALGRNPACQSRPPPLPPARLPEQPPRTRPCEPSPRSQ